MADPEAPPPSALAHGSKNNETLKMLENAPFAAWDVSGALKKVAVPPVVCINYYKKSSPPPPFTISWLAIDICIENVILGSGPVG